MSDASIKAFSKYCWNISVQGISITYSFDEKNGLIMDIDNMAGERPVHYSHPDNCILPIDNDALSSHLRINTAWVLESAGMTQGEYGGKPVARLDIIISTLNIRLYLHVVAFPDTSIIRHWFDIENTSVSKSIECAIRPFGLKYTIDDYRDTYRCYWLTGGKPEYNHGLMRSEPLGLSSNVDMKISSKQHYDYVPVLMLLRENSPYDGFMAALDYCGDWNLEIVKHKRDPVSFAFRLDNGKPLILEPEELFELPVVTLATYKESLDHLMKAVYDWQYTYMFDYTNNDYYARTRGIVPWVFNSRNLHEQFAFRLAGLDMQAVQLQEAGYEILWDDAGWSAYPGWPPDSYQSVFENNYEGPDFRQSRRFFKKCGIGWLLWFAGKPSIGLLESKEGSWGAYEWRTDGLDICNIREEAAFKRKIKRYLDGDPGRSFHTCSGGGTYAHTFDIQRYANYNYSADLGAGPYGNYYFSYLELPDKWGDVLCLFGSKYLGRDGASFNPGDRVGEEEVKYVPEFARARLGMVPIPGPARFAEDMEAVRKDLEIYRYLIYKGVAGRWSYMFHPMISGDHEYYYMQRTSRDFKRSCILLRHTPQGPVIVFPRGLLEDELYHIGFQNSGNVTERYGRDIMDIGIRMENVLDGELIYLNLPDRPGNGADVIPPVAPEMAICRIEDNIGYTGMGIYWSPGRDESWISYYEISRDGRIIGRVSTGCYYFDYPEGLHTEADYAVRTVDGDGNRSGWTKARMLEHSSIVFSALGSHNSTEGFNGWSAEISSDLMSFKPMKWVPPESNPAGDLGGTPNQPGGMEGYWEGGACARAGRGWQQASQDVFCVRSYKILYDSTVRITGRAVKEWYHQDKGCDLGVCILQNDHKIWPAEGWAVLKKCDLYGAGHDIRLQVKMGDTIRFIVDKSSGGDEDLLPWLERVNLVGWIPRITYESSMVCNDIDRESVLRISCGSDSTIIDSVGNEWEGDQFFRGGSKISFNGGTCFPGDTKLLSTGRTGDEFLYEIPVTHGIYSVRLCFAEFAHQWNGEREMDIWINGAAAAKNLDVRAAARGAYKGYERIFNYIVPDRDGKIQIHFKACKGDALIQAIEVAPEQKDAVRINCGCNHVFIDWAGYAWKADCHFRGGKCIKAGGELLQATPTLYDRDLYFAGRSGRHLEYRIPVKPGIYSVHLKFAEMWLKEEGQRPLNIYLNKRLVRGKWDPAHAVGHVCMAADLRFEGISPVDQHISIRIDAVGENPAVLQAIEIE